MQDVQTGGTPKLMRWAGTGLSALVVLFLIFDGVIKVMRDPHVDQAMKPLGYPLDLSPTIGVIELACLILYVVPPTSILGAVLMTGLLGGAIASHVRVGDPLFSHTLFGVYVGVLAWGGLYLRDARLRSLLPLRR